MKDRTNVTLETVWHTALRAYANVDIVLLTDTMNALEQQITGFDDYIDTRERPGGYSSTTVGAVLLILVERAVEQWKVYGMGEHMECSILVKIDKDGAVSIQYIPVETFELPAEDDDVTGD